MFEYIKRVSVAISFIAQKVDESGLKVKNVLETLSLDLLLIAQLFKDDKYKGEDLQKLEEKISYLIDVVDFARISGFVSYMNAKVFTDSQVAFLRHVYNLIDQKTSLSIPLYHLKELDDHLARKHAKENLQNKFDFNFTDTTGETRNKNLSYQNVTTQTATKSVVKDLVKKEVESEKEIPQEIFADAPKKIVEEVLIAREGSYEKLEKEIKERRNRILQALTSGGGSIKEISSKMKDVSEKTIQRDLLELMRDKKVIMLGKKRWAKYYLK